MKNKFSNKKNKSRFALSLLCLLLLSSSAVYGMDNNIENNIHVNKKRKNIDDSREESEKKLKKDKESFSSNLTLKKLAINSIKKQINKNPFDEEKVKNLIEKYSVLLKGSAGLPELFLRRSLRNFKEEQINRKDENYDSILQALELFTSEKKHVFIKNMHFFQDEFKDWNDEDFFKLWKKTGDNELLKEVIRRAYANRMLTLTFNGEDWFRNSKFTHRPLNEFFPEFSFASHIYFNYKPEDGQKALGEMKGFYNNKSYNYIDQFTLPAYSNKEIEYDKTLNRRSPSLSSIELKHKRVEPDELTSTLQRLSQFKVSINSEIYFANLNSNQIIEVSKFLETNTTVSRLKLAIKGFDDRAAESFINAFQKNKTLFSINIEGPRGQIEHDRLLLCLSKILETNTTLAALKFDSILPFLEVLGSVVEDGTKAFAEGIKKNTTLRKLSLGSFEGYVDKGDHTIDAFGEVLGQDSFTMPLLLTAISENKGIEEIDFDGMGQVDFSPFNFTDFLAKNDTLHTVSLSKASTGDELVELLKSLQNNKVVKKLFILDTYLTKRVEEFTQLINTHAHLDTLRLRIEGLREDEYVHSLGKGLQKNNTLSHLELGLSSIKHLKIIREYLKESHLNVKIFYDGKNLTDEKINRFKNTYRNFDFVESSLPEGIFDD